MGYSCFCSGCKSGYKSFIRERRSRGERTPAVFSAPKDIELLEKWRKAIPRRDKQLTSKDHVCSLHFSEDDIIFNFEEKCTDGKVWKLKRAKPKLKKGAVPSIFHCEPEGSSSRKRIRLKSRECKKYCMDLQDIPVCQEIFNFQYLKENIASKLNKVWKPFISEDFVAFMLWSSSELEKYIVLDKDLNVKVYLKGTETTFKREVIIASMQDLLLFLVRVEKLTLCPGNKKKDMSCLGYLKNTVTCKRTGLCKPCQLMSNRRNNTSISDAEKETEVCLAEIWVRFPRKRNVPFTKFSTSKNERR